jgi:hypothetical protein
MAWTHYRSTGPVPRLPPLLRPYATLVDMPVSWQLIQAEVNKLRRSKARAARRRQVAATRHRTRTYMREYRAKQEERP